MTTTRKFVRTASSGGPSAKANNTAIGLSPDRYHFLSKIAERRDITRTALLNQIVDNFIDDLIAERSIS